MPLKRKKLVHALRQKGFKEETKDRDHDFFRLVREGIKEAVYTKVSRGTGYRDLGPQLVSRIRRQLKLEGNELSQLVECPLSEEGYIQLLKDRNVLD